jgi:hypothetical protein
MDGFYSCTYCTYVSYYAELKILALTEGKKSEANPKPLGKNRDGHSAENWPNLREKCADR